MMEQLGQQAVDLYAQGLSFEDVAQVLGIGERLTRNLIHAVAPGVVRRKGQRVRKPDWFQEARPEDRGRCQLCGILLDQVGDDPKARYCHWCREEGWVELMEDRARERAVTTDHGGDIT
jgi:hypothetical protein